MKWNVQRHIVSSTPLHFGRVLRACQRRQQQQQASKQPNYSSQNDTCFECQVIRKSFLAPPEIDGDDDDAWKRGTNASHSCKRHAHLHRKHIPQGVCIAMLCRVCHHQPWLHQKGIMRTNGGTLCVYVWCHYTSAFATFEHTTTGAHIVSQQSALMKNATDTVTVICNDSGY